MKEKPKNKFTNLWKGWILYFLVVEFWAVITKNKSTLTHTIKWYIGPWVILAFGVWATGHLLEWWG